MESNMEMKFYESPSAEVIELIVEQIFAASDDGTGKGDDWPDFQWY